MRIGITYNLKSSRDEIFEEFDTDETIDAIADVLEKNGHSVVKLGWGKSAVQELLSGEQIDFVFNICEGFSGRNREAGMPAVLEMLDIPYSGSDSLAMSLTLDKAAAKAVCNENNIKTPDYSVISTPDDIKAADERLKYPLFLKPAWEGSSKGIRQGSKAVCKKDMAGYALYLLENYPKQPVLVEEYIKGAEFTVGILGNVQPQVLGIMQITPKTAGEKDFFYSIEVKRDWQNLVEYECPAKLTEALSASLTAAAIKAFKAFGCRDVSRIDFRVTDRAEVYFIELNPLPGLSPEYSDFVIMARRMGWTYQKLIMAIFNNALSRYNIEKVLSGETV